MFKILQKKRKKQPPNQTFEKSRRKNVLKLASFGIFD